MSGIFNSSIFNNAIFNTGVEEAAEPGHAVGGGGAPFMLSPIGRRLKKKDVAIREALEAAFEAFNAAPAPIAEQVREIVAPVAEPAARTPNVVRVNLEAIMENLRMVEKLLALHERLERVRIEEERDEEDIEFLLLH